MKWAALAGVAVLLALPAVLSSYMITIFILIFFYGFLGQAWNVVGGYAGQLSAGHAAFVGIGGYTAALLSSELGLTPWLGMFVGAVLASALGAVFLKPSLKELFSFSLLIVILLFRPAGLFGKRAQ